METNIKIGIDVNDEVMENIIVTAIEGASNYWYYLNSDALDIIRSNSTHGKSLSEKIWEAVKNGAEIPVHDIEDSDGEAIGVLSIESVTNGLQKLANSDMAKFLFMEINEDGDGESSDIVFQFIVLGEYVYA